MSVHWYHLAVSSFPGSPPSPPPETASTSDSAAESRHPTNTQSSFCGPQTLRIMPNIVYASDTSHLPIIAWRTLHRRQVNQLQDFQECTGCCSRKPESLISTRTELAPGSSNNCHQILMLNLSHPDTLDNGFRSFGLFRPNASATARVTVRWWLWCYWNVTFNGLPSLPPPFDHEAVPCALFCTCIFSTDCN